MSLVERGIRFGIRFCEKQDVHMEGLNGKRGGLKRGACLAGIYVDIRPAIQKKKKKETIKQKIFIYNFIPINFFFLQTNEALLPISIFTF